MGMVGRGYVQRKFIQKVCENARYDWGNHISFITAIASCSKEVGGPLFFYASDVHADLQRQCSQEPLRNWQIGEIC